MQRLFWMALQETFKKDKIIIMTNEQIKEKALELFIKHGPLRNRGALSELYDIVFASGRIFERDMHMEVDRLAWAVYPVPDFLQDTVNKLNSLLDKKATVVKSGDWGYCTSFVCTIVNVYIRNYAQYDNCLFIKYLLPRKRIANILQILPYQSIAIYAGEHKVNTQTLKKIVRSTDEVTFTSLGSAFDDGHFTGAIHGISVPPVFIQHSKN